MVTGVTYRHPGVLVKTATTLDVLSGAAPTSASAPPGSSASTSASACHSRRSKERFERLEETLQIAQQMWGEAPAPFEGQALPARRDALRPPPDLARRTRRSSSAAAASRRRCGSSRSTPTRRTSRPASTTACVEELRHKFDVLREHCRSEGRNFDEIEKTTLGTLWMAPGRGGRSLALAGPGARAPREVPRRRRRSGHLQHAERRSPGDARVHRAQCDRAGTAPLIRARPRV